MPDKLRMTLSTGSREFCLHYAERELYVLMGLRGADSWFPEGQRFVQVTGVFANFSVAKGQDENAWFRVHRSDVLKAAEGVLRASEREVQRLKKRRADWAGRMAALVHFLKASRAKNLRIRHHYAHGTRTGSGGTTSPLD